MTRTLHGDPGIAERYLLGRLSETERDDYERHFFECDECAADLAALQRIRDGLEGTPATRPIASQPLRSLGRPLRLRVWPWAALAAMLAAAVGVRLWLQPEGQETGAPGGELPAAPAPSSPTPLPPGPGAGSSVPGTGAPEPVVWARLAGIRPAAWTAPRLRGGQSEAERRFEGGMQRYARADYAGAIPLLAAAADLDPQDPGARFFLGVSRLLEGQVDEGIAALRGTVALGSSPYLEEARIYIARADLLKGNPDAALQELEEAIRLQGDLEPEARELRRAIRDAQGKSE